MDHARGLTAGSAVELEARAPDCPDCGAPSANVPPVTTWRLGDAWLRRCHRCSGRHSCESVPRPVRLCPDCRLPYLSASPATERCTTCATGGFRVGPSEASLVAAAEEEVRRALAANWSFVGSERISSYLSRVLRAVASRVDGAPTGGDVHIVREPLIRTLGLPSGAVVLSLGALGGLEDEAELAFVLGHELAHASSGASAAALTVLGLRELALGRYERNERAWLHATEDLIRLGHGDQQEYEADAAALSAVVSLGYDGEAAVHYLRRIRQATDRGAPEVAELALAHPLPALRLQRVERLRNVRCADLFADRLNREVFRRAAGHTVLARELSPVRAFDDGSRRGRLARRLADPRLWWAVGSALLFLLLVLLYTLL